MQALVDHALFDKFLVSEETVLLLRWGRERRKSHLIKRVDKGRITIVKVM